MNEATLNGIEQSIAKHIAQKRYENARSKNIKDLKMGDQSNWDTDLEGFGAEMAFCKIMNIYPDLKIGLENDYDCLYNALKIDVKTSKYKTAKMLATLKKKDSNVDVYVLIVGKFPGPYKLVGACWKDQLIKQENIRDLGRGAGYCLEQKDLLSFDELIRRENDI